MNPVNANQPAHSQQFERILAQTQFDGLKAILQRVSPEPQQLPTFVLQANSYADLLDRLGYRLTIIRQIHVQDCYERLGATGGIKAILPYYDIPTQRSLPTLVNLDATVSATPGSAAFFEALFLELKRQFQAQA